jgi:ATP-dependent Clp protease ATP-binding subunit ClpA
MFERFTVPARTVVVGAQEQARSRRAERIRTEHLLLALFTTPDDLAATILNTFGVDREAVERAVDDRRTDGPVPDASALAVLGIDLDQVRRQVEEAFGPGALERTGGAGGRRGRHLPFEQEARKVLGSALREAQRMRHRHIGTEHIMLGLLIAEGAARDILAERGVRLEAARVIVEKWDRHPRAC